MAKEKAMIKSRLFTWVAIAALGIASVPVLARTTKHSSKTTTTPTSKVATPVVAPSSAKPKPASIRMGTTSTKAHTPVSHNTRKPAVTTHSKTKLSTSHAKTSHRSALTGKSGKTTRLSTSNKSHKLSTTGKSAKTSKALKTTTHKTSPVKTTPKTSPRSLPLKSKTPTPSKGIILPNIY